MIPISQLERNLDTLVVLKVILAAVILSVAEASVLVLMTSVGLILFSRYLRMKDIALPRWLVNITCVMMVFVLAANILKEHNNQLDILIAMGHFTLSLQVIQLYSKMTLREYNLVMTLGLLQVLAANIFNVSLNVGLLTLIYAVLGLLSLLAYQMKRSRDSVDDANRGYRLGRKKVQFLEVGLAGGQSKSFWRNMLVSEGYRLAIKKIVTSCFLVSIFVFIAVPRSGRYHEAQSFIISASAIEEGQQNTVGYDNNVNLRNPSPKVGADNNIVMSVRIERNGESINDLFLLRGAALEQYDQLNGSWNTNKRGAKKYDLRSGQAVISIPLIDEPTMSIEVDIRNANSKSLFTLGSPLSFESEVISKISYSKLDETIYIPENTSFHGPISYKLTVRENKQGYPARRTSFKYAEDWYEAERYRAYGMEILKKRNVLAEEDTISTLDQKLLATTLANYLAGSPEYTYTLDNPMPDSGKDPVSQFLFEWKRGHCELYSAAHAALCRSLGLRARVVTGYRLSEYNQLTQAFVVRPGHAHSWTEVECNGRWVTFDPTSPVAVAEEHASVKPRWIWLSHSLDMINASWIRNVMAFDKESRSEFLSLIGLDAKGRENILAWIKKHLLALFLKVDQGKAEAVVLLGLVLLFFVWCLTSLLLLWRNHKRFKLIDLKGVSRKKRKTLRRDLSFYFRLLSLIKKAGFKKPPWQSHQRYIEQVIHSGHPSFQSDEIKRKMLSLNALFYRIRFGEMTPDQARLKASHQDVDQIKRLIRLAKSA